MKSQRTVERQNKRRYLRLLRLRQRAANPMTSAVDLLPLIDHPDPTVRGWARKHRNAPPEVRALEALGV